MLLQILRIHSPIITLLLKTKNDKSVKAKFFWCEQDNIVMATEKLIEKRWAVPLIMLCEK